MVRSFISCGKLSFAMLFPFIAPVFCFIDSLCISSISNQWKKHTALVVFFLSLGQLLSGIVLYSIYFIQSSRRRPIEKTNHLVNTITTFTKTQYRLGKGRKRKYVFLVFPAVFYLLSMFSVNFASAFFNYQITKLTAVVFQIIFASSLCWLALSVQFYQHHFWSFPVILIGYALVCGINYSFFLKNGSMMIPLHLVLNFCAYLFFTVEEVMEKRIMNKLFIGPPTILLIEGAFNTAVMTLLIVVLHFFPCDGFSSSIQYCNPVFQRDHIESFTYLPQLFRDSNNGWYFIGLMVSSGGFNTMVKYTVYKYSPIHRCVSDLLSCIFSVLYFELPMRGLAYTGLSAGKEIVMMIGYAVILLSCLVYNEFIILHCCGLGENTKKMIEERTQQEVITEASQLQMIEQQDDEKDGIPL